MVSLPITVASSSRVRGRRTLRIEVDADRLERLAADLGLFRPEFLVSLDRAEADVLKGRVRRITSLAQLRSRRRAR